MAAYPDLVLKAAARAVWAGGVIAYPTEGLWGLGCDPGNAHACLKLLQIKRRHPAKGLIVLAARADQLQPYIAASAYSEYLRLTKESPGETWIVPASAGVPDWLSGGRETLAVRVSSHPVARRLCELAEQPLVSTSANRSGHTPARSALQLRRQFAGELAQIVPGTAGGRPTRIRRFPAGEVLR